MDRIWLKHYPVGVPADIDPDEYRSLVHLLESLMATHAGQDALVYMGKVLRYADLDRLSGEFAGWLQSLSLPRGTRVALMVPNCHAYVVGLLGCLRAGMTAVNVNPLYTPRELSVLLKDSGAEVIVVLENFAHTLQPVLAGSALRHVVLVSVGDLLGRLKGLLTNLVVRHVKRMVRPYQLPGALRLEKCLAMGRAHGFVPPEIGPGDLAVLQYTGGTSGVPKGAMLTQRNLLANTLQATAWFHPAMEQPGRPRPQGPPIFVGALPLYHIYALMVCLLVSLNLGGKLILIPNPRDVDALVKALKPHRVVVFPGLSTLYNLLLAHAGFRGLDFSNLRLSLAGGMAVASSVARRWQQVTGCAVCEGYGMTEASPTVCCTPTDATGFSGTIGVPLPSTEVKILDDAGRELPPGEPGELALKGPQLMAGYWQREVETRDFTTPDGFFRSGDIATMDERGFVRILDRKKDVIVVAGFNVYSNEVEEVVCTCPGVKECAAIGVPDEHSGQAVKIFVVRSAPDLDEATVLAHCAAGLTGYKRPRHLVFVKSLPKSDVGKVLRRLLRDGTVVPEPDVQA